MATMKALWWLGTEKKLEYLKNVAEPNVEKSNDVKIKVHFSGVCGTDFHFMKGEMGKFIPKQDGVILGHEFSGVVTAIGDGVQRIKVGDNVAVHPNQDCGKCMPCTNNQPNYCFNNINVGVKRNGGWAEYAVVPQKLVFKLTDDVSLKQGALAEPYACVIRGWKNLGEMNPSQKVLIQGAGIIGLMFSSLFKVNGFKDVTMVEMQQGRKDMFANSYPEYKVFDPVEHGKMMEQKDSDNEGYDVIVDCSGNCKAVEKTICMAKRGAKISMFGCCPAGEKISIEPFLIYWKELTITGSFVSPNCFEETVDLLSKLNTNEMLDVEKLGVQIFDLSSFNQAFDALKSGRASKAMFTF